jgi:DnaJ-class molecular chaperone
MPGMKYFYGFGSVGTPSGGEQNSAGMLVTYTSGDSKPWKWVACSGCGGSGGRVHVVDWAVAAQWHTCLFCGGAGGSMRPD